MLQCFHMTNCKPLSVSIFVGTKLLVEQCPTTPTKLEDMTYVPYANAIGILKYAMVCTRPTISQVVGVLSRFMTNPRREHWAAVKRVFGYLWDTSEYSICYHNDGLGDPHLMDIHVYVDSDWAWNVYRRISMNGYIFQLFGGVVSWMRKWQTVVALSISEAGYMADTHACEEAIWIMKLCSKVELS